MNALASSPSLERPSGVSIGPRLGFLGVGWIGRHRLEAISRSGFGQISAIADTSPECVRGAAGSAPGAALLSSLDDLLNSGVEGIVIATPSALHTEQSVHALDSGKAVFCQKPIGRTAAETARVISAASRADLLLGVDLSYRFMTGAQKIHHLCRSGELGEIYALDLTFHNAYGPDKPWFYEPSLSGGGCVIDLGIHLVDLALWNLGFPEISNVTSRLFSRGRPVGHRREAVEDYAEARLDLATGATIRLTCSWKLPAGREALINGAFYGTKGGAAFSNVAGSFYEFEAERFHGTRREVLASGAEEWGGRAAVDWAQKLASGARFDPEILHLNRVAQALDAIYEFSD